MKNNGLQFQSQEIFQIFDKLQPRNDEAVIELKFQVQVQDS